MSENKLVKKETVLSLSKNVLGRMMNEVEEFAKIEKTPLTDSERSFALEILQDINKKVTEGKVQWNEIDVVGCALYSQVKSFARIGLSSINKEIYIDIRNNKYTEKKDIQISKQYQGIEKEMIKWSSKKIVRFYKDVVVTGDDFEMVVDFTTGILGITKHKKNKDIDRNVLDNVVGAYAIAYVKENDELVPYISYVDKNRIMRAYNASPMGTKAIWKQDTAKMVIKTAVWELYSLIKPFINLPVELKQDWANTNENMDWVNTETVEEEIEKEIKIDANSGEVFYFKEEIEEKIKEEQPKNNRGF